MKKGKVNTDKGSCSSTDNIIDSFFHNLTFRQLLWIGLAVLIGMSVLIRIHLAPNTGLSPDYDTYFAKWVAEYRSMGFWQGLGHTIGDYFVPMNFFYAIISLFPFEPWVMMAFIACIFDYAGAFAIYKIAGLLIRDGKLNTFNALNTSDMSKKVNASKALNAENTVRTTKMSNSDDTVGAGKGAKGSSGFSMRAAYIGVLSLYIPCVIVNSALWKQGDSIYVFFALAAIYYLLDKRYGYSLFWYAVSFSFKQQAIFLLPFFIIMYFAKKDFSIRYFLWLPTVFAVAGLPSVILQRGIRATYGAYMVQANETTTEGYGMNSFLPNIYALGLDDYYDLLALPAGMVTVAALGILLLFIVRHRERLDTRRILMSAIVVLWTCVMFLPGMHERYDYLMLVLLPAAALTGSRKLVIPAIAANFCSFLTHVMILFHAETIPIMYICLIYISAYIYTVLAFYKELSGKEVDSQAVNAG